MSEEVTTEKRDARVGILLLYRNAIIEECARVAEDRRWGVHTPLEEIAAAIRGLKEET